jgi:hypothetical protein
MVIYKLDSLAARHGKARCNVVQKSGGQGFKLGAYVVCINVILSPLSKIRPAAPPVPSQSPGTA